MVKNLHASAGDMGLTPGPGIFHVPTEQLSHALKLASLHSGVYELQLLRPTCPKAHGLQLEKLEHCDLRGACAAAMRTLCYQKKKKIIQDPKKQRPVSVSCALSLGVEGGDAGEKGEPV